MKIEENDADFEQFQADLMQEEQMEREQKEIDQRDIPFKENEQEQLDIIKQNIRENQEILTVESAEKANLELEIEDLDQ